MADPVNETDALDDALKAVGAQKPVEGMLTPQQMEERERQAAGGGATPAAEATPPAAGAGPQGADGASDIDYDGILRKVEAAQPLTNDEVALLAVMQKELEAGPGPQGAAPATVRSYVVAGKSYTEQEVEQQMLAEYGLASDLALSPEGKAKMIERYVKSANRSEQQVNNQRQSETNAHERQANMIERVHLADERKAITRERERLTRAKETLTAAAKGLIPKEELIDPTTNQIDPDKLYLYNQARTAADQLPGIDSQLADLNRSESENEGKAVKADVMAFIADHPQYQTAEDPFALFNRLSRGEQLDEADELKVLELDELLTEARTRGVPLDKVFTIHKAQRKLAVPVPAQTGAPGKGRIPLPDLQANPKTMAEMIRAHRTRMAAAPRGAGPSGGGGERGTGTMTQARATIEADRKILGQSQDAFVHELGF